jgi:hypothetical protein
MRSAEWVQRAGISPQDEIAKRIAWRPEPPFAAQRRQADAGGSVCGEVIKIRIDWSSPMGYFDQTELLRQKPVRSHA